MRRLIGILLVSGLALTGCSALFPSSTSTPTGENVDLALEPFYAQELQWSACESTMQCATATAPLDWNEPDGETIELALIRQTARGDRLGSLFVNPGGPGASGYDFLAGGADSAVDRAVQDRYDIVSWDPRGVGRSTAVSCGTNEDIDDYLYSIVDGEVLSDEWFAENDRLTAAFVENCLADTGPLLGHVGTIDTVRDLDMLRAAIGDEKLTYLGYSYGTLIGAMYAEAFPERTGRLVLDGAVDPASSLLDVVLTQSAGFEGAFRAYLEYCLSSSGCPFSGTVEEALDTVADLSDTLDASPLRNADGRELGSDTMDTAISYPLYSESRWTQLDDLFSTVFAGDPSYAFTLADAYNGRLDDGSYDSNIMLAFGATTCLDYPAKASVDEARASVAAYENESPVFGREAGLAVYSCTGWPYDATREVGAITAPGSPDILVIGTTNDPATPYANAVSLADQLENGHLVSFEGEGHTAYNGISECVDDAVDAYLIDGAVPPVDPNC